MSIRDRLRLVFRPTRQVSVECGAPEPYLPPPTELEFVAYAEDCRLFGHLGLSAQRLTDMLNEATEVELVDVAMEALADGRIVEMRTMIVARDELLVVQASGPRGARERRHRTRPHPVAVQTGPYHVRGHLHALPTADPFAALRRRPPMVPLTEGSITYQVGSQSVVRRADTMIVNREVMDWIVPATDEAVQFPELPTVTGILVKDFTGQIHAAMPDATETDGISLPPTGQPAAPERAVARPATGPSDAVTLPDDADPLELEAAAATAILTLRATRATQPGGGTRKSGRELRQAG